MTSLTPRNTGSFVKRVRRLYRHARKHGTAKAAYSLAQAVVRLPGMSSWMSFGAAEIYHHSVDDWPCDTRIPRAYEVRVAGDDDIAKLAHYFEDPDRIQRRHRRGDVCLVTMNRGTICAAVWFALGPNTYHEDWDAFRCTFQFPANTTWCFDGKGTRLGAWGSLMAKVPEFLRQRNITDVYTLIGCNNWQSIDSHRSLGYRSLGYITCLGISSRRNVLFRKHGCRWQCPPGSMDMLELTTGPAE